MRAWGPNSRGLEPLDDPVEGGSPQITPNPMKLEDNPIKRVTPETPAMKTPPLRAGRGHIQSKWIDVRLREIEFERERTKALVELAREGMNSLKEYYLKKIPRTTLQL